MSPAQICVTSFVVLVHPVEVALLSGSSACKHNGSVVERQHRLDRLGDHHFVSTLCLVYDNKVVRL